MTNSVTKPEDAQSEPLAISGTYKIPNSTMFTVAYGDIEGANFTHKFNQNGNIITIGAFQKIAAKTISYLMYSDVDAENDYADREKLSTLFRNVSI